MSERKTTEIKLRVTPAEKAAWQLAAEEDAIGLSELIRREMNARAQRNITTLDVDTAQWTTTLHQVAVSGGPAGYWVEDTEREDPSAVPAWRYEIPVLINGDVPPGYAVLTNLSPVVPEVDEGTSNDVGTSDGADSVAKPWMFEARASE